MADARKISVRPRYFIETRVSKRELLVCSLTTREVDVIRIDPFNDGVLIALVSCDASQFESLKQEGWKMHGDRNNVKLAG